MVLALLQARMSSCRMPGKVMAPVLGEPMIWRQLERLRRARTLSKVVVATSSASSDDPLAGFLLGRGCSVHRADPADVLGGFAACATGWSSDHVVLLTADSPLADPQVIDAGVALALKSGAAYVTNGERRTYPEGLEVEVLTAAALVAATQQARDPRNHEHVTQFIRRHPKLFPQAHLTQARDLSDLRWTVERPEDFAFVREVYQRLYPDDPGFGMKEVLELLEARPDLAALTPRREAATETGAPAAAAA